MASPQEPRASGYWIGKLYKAPKSAEVVALEARVAALESEADDWKAACEESQASEADLMERVAQLEAELLERTRQVGLTWERSLAALARVAALTQALEELEFWAIAEQARFPSVHARTWRELMMEVAHRARAALRVEQ